LEPFFREGETDWKYLDETIRAWIKRKQDIDPEEHDPEEGNEDYWKLIEPELSWKWFQLLEATRDGWSGQWAFLPYGGSWADQPAWLVNDLTLIGEFKRMLEEQLKPSV